MRLLLSGYYGFGNTGDEAILAATVAALRRRLPSAGLTVLSADPPATAAAYGVRAARRWHLPTIWREIGRTDLLLQGGGGLIQDSTSRLSPLYYLGLLILARLRRKPFVIYAQGVGPLRSGLVRWLTGRVFDCAAAITVRDEASAALLRQLGVRREIAVTADAAALLEAADAEAVAQFLPAAPSGPLVGLALREAPGGERLVEGAIRAARRLRQVAGAQCLVLPFHARDDGPLAERVAEAVGGRVVTGATPAEWLGIIARLDFVLSMRLHAGIFAAMTGVPFVSLPYDPKVAAFAESVGAPRVSADADPEDVASVVERAWATREAGAGTRREAAERLRARAQANVELVAELAGRMAEQSRNP